MDRSFARITLEQWRAFVAAAQSGSFLQAAERLGKTQSAISHAVRKMEECLGQDLFVVEGRRTRLTHMGRMVLPRARELVGHAAQIERFCTGFDPEAEGEVAIAIDIIFPRPLLFRALSDYARIYPNLSVIVHETALSGAKAMMEDGRISIAIAGQLPTSTIVEPILPVRFLCVAAPGHPLQALPEPTHAVLKEHRQVVLSDSGPRGVDSGWLGSRRRWTVSHIATSIALVCAGEGFAWLPEHAIRDELAAGRLRPLPLAQGARRVVQLHLGYMDHDGDMRQVLDLVGVFRDAVAEAEDEDVGPNGGLRPSDDDDAGART